MQNTYKLIVSSKTEGVEFCIKVSSSEGNAGDEVIAQTPYSCEISQSPLFVLVEALNPSKSVTLEVARGGRPLGQGEDSKLGFKADCASYSIFSYS